MFHRGRQAGRQEGRNGIRVRAYEIEVKKGKSLSSVRGGNKGKNTVVGSSCFARNSPLVTRTETGGMKAGSKVLVRTEFPTLDAGYEA